ncbi:Predicted arabinose efflux permease, MFS family [Monaibacterium marinum]|uniref:Predicted arabinose efflux permease, MFS family n=1 Tax=Pontivivens marinum TaxID=1690039 RepID=A0A2C9CPB6_9RHOB|nr:MFS transporter [Monaibacterium marinum]SOH93035.1 Predicted arabinose efflux permease, MFS family [Monaibacterium marinum]
MRTVTLDQAKALPIWGGPIALLILMAAAMPLAFSTWNALLNNFVIEAAQFDGSDIGWLQTVREIPGFLAVGVIAIIIYVREQILGLVSLIMLGVAVAITAYFPTFQGLLVTTLIGSIGFHYYETVNQSLQLQWIDKKRAPQMLGWIVAVGSGASLLAYGLLVLGWKNFGWTYEAVYLVGGGATVLLALFCFVMYPQFESPNPQIKRMVLRRRYWLYYALQFMSGARRQIFVVFAAFMMVERFGFEVHEVTGLFIANYVANMFFAPMMGGFVQKFGERRALIVEYIGLIGIFLAYGALYFASWGDLKWGVMIAAGLYVLDHLFFALAFALKTYFQKIADPEDIAPTAAVAFTINHIAAVGLPAALGYLWLTSPAGVFILAAGFACVSLMLALMIPRHPAKGHETVFAPRLTRAPAE